MLRRIFQVESSARNFTEMGGGGDFQRGWNCPVGLYGGGVVFYVEATFRA